MISRGTQVLRSLFIAALSVLVAALAHVFGGGNAPSWVALALALAFATLVSIPLVGKRMSLPRVTIAVTIAQTFFHTVFAVIGNAGNVVASGTGHHDVAFTVATGAINHGAHGAVPMTVGHAIAGIVTIVALCQGIAALTAIVASARRQIRRVLVSRFAPVSIRRAPATLVFHWGAIAETLQSLRSVVSRRGPPIAAAVFS
ncbi:hypothetical protein FB472_2163 [Rhodoglobus vestalii]|uniref:Uncharacterized protein n=1 Tax=Rhodoglobus vestalii TaxID=193384 RepID=A0A8H2PZA9_9MICO|nr:hypothetical protein [Rhodoglobus vestalii]TQO20528.1 hypothetical protein FB472_2163 [Rhodoglobus vestalii]